MVYSQCTVRYTRRSVEGSHGGSRRRIIYAEPGHYAAADGATWCKDQPICGAYCCRKEAGRNVYNHEKEQARKKLKHTPVPDVPHFTGKEPSLAGGKEPSLADLQAEWRGELYAEPRTKLNGHAVGEFGWKGISVSRDGGKELLRVKLGHKKLGPTKKRPPPGSDEEKEVVRELALRLIAAVQAAGGAGGTGGPCHRRCRCHR